MSRDIKIADWVRTKQHSGGALGIVRRIAKDGSWCDVRWRLNGDEWSKRMATDALEVLHTIPFMGGTVTDVTRKLDLDKFTAEPRP